MGKLSKVSCTTVPCELPAPEKGPDNKWVLPLDPKIIVSRSGEQRTEVNPRVSEAALRTASTIACWGRDCRRPKVSLEAAGKLPCPVGATPHTSPSLRCWARVRKTPFVLLSIPSSLKVSCSTPTKSPAETAIEEKSRFLKQAEISATAILPHIWTPFSPFIFSFLSQAPWQVSSLFLVLQLLPHSTWTPEPSHKIRIMNNVHRLLRCICFPLPGLQDDWRGTSTDSWTNPTPPRRTGTAAYPGSLLKHYSLLFHVRGSFFQQLATEDPAALEKQGWEGALRDKDAQHSKRYAALLGSPQKCPSPHHPTLTAISRYGNQGTEGGRSDISNLGFL